MPEAQEKLNSQCLDIDQQLKDVANRYALMDNLMEGCQVKGFDWLHLYANETLSAYCHILTDAETDGRYSGSARRGGR